MYIIYSIACGKGVCLDDTLPWLYDEDIIMGPSECVWIVPGTVSVDD